MASPQEPVKLERPKKRVTFGLIVLAILMPWLALYLDGSSWQTVGINVALYLPLFPLGLVFAPIHAIVCLLRTDDHRKYSRPARRSLRYDNKYSADTSPQTAKIAEESAQEPEPAPVTRAAIEDEPKPVEKAPTEPPAKTASAATSSTSVSSSDVEKAPAEPPAKNASAATSSTSVSSSDVEKEAEPAPAPPQRTATAPPQRTATAPPARIATAPPSRAATAKKEDDPFKDPNA